MRISKVAKRYAKGLLDYSEEFNITDNIYKEMSDVVSFMNNSKEFNSFLNGPYLDTKKKINIINQIFSNFSKPSVDFISLVVKHNRENQLKSIAQAYVESVDDRDRVQKVFITSAAVLSNKNIDEIVNSSFLVDKSNKVSVKTMIKPEILGGYILRVGDQQIDESIRTKLADIKKKFDLN